MSRSLRTCSKAVVYCIFRQQSVINQVSNYLCFAIWLITTLHRFCRLSTTKVTLQTLLHLFTLIVIIVRKITVNLSCFYTWRTQSWLFQSPVLNSCFLQSKNYIFTLSPQKHRRITLFNVLRRVIIAKLKVDCFELH